MHEDFELSPRRQEHEPVLHARLQALETCLTERPPATAS
jgi:hypothetical protein